MLTLLTVQKDIPGNFPCQPICFMLPHYQLTEEKYFRSKEKFVNIYAFLKVVWNMVL